MVRTFLVLSFFVIAISSAVVFADSPVVPAGTPPAAAQSDVAGAPQQPGMLGMLAPFAIMFGVVYFLMIRPQQKRLKDQQDMLTNLKNGDQILTTSGMLGKVTGIAEKVVTVEVADNVRVKMLKSQVSQVIKGPLKDQMKDLA